LEDTVMESIRGRVIGFARMQGKEDVFIARALGTLIALLEKVPKSKEYEFQCGVSSLLSEFSTAFVAALAIIRSGRPLQEIEQMEKSLRETSEGSQIQFIGHILSSLCLQANLVAVEIAVFFLNVRSDRIVSAAKNLLEKSGQNDRSRNTIVSVLQKWILRKPGILTLLAKIDAQAAIKSAVNLLTNGNSGIRYESFSTLVAGPLVKEIVDTVVKTLKDAKAKILWESVDHRGAICDFIKRAFEDSLLSKEDALEILRIAFQYEHCNRGLAHLLLAIKTIDPENKPLLMNAFLAVEKNGGGNSSFNLRRDSVEEFITGLTETELVDFLQKILSITGESESLWFAGQHLIAVDVAVAARIFAKIARAKKTPKERIGTLAQLAMKVCDDTENRWLSTELNKKPKFRFAPVAQVLFDYAEEDACPLETRLIIAYQPGMYGSSDELCHRAIPLLGSVILDEKASPEQVTEALRALLNTCLKKGLGQEVDAVLKKVYASPRRKLLLDQMLFILVNDIRGYPMEPLYPAIVSFLANSKAADAVPILKKALNAERPNADLGMTARTTYVAGLKKFSLEGSIQAVAAISGYCGDNIWGKVIPKTLVDIYTKTTSKAVSEKVALGASERFLLSINEAGCNRLFYLNELIAMEGLKDSPIIQAAFLKGIAAIGEGNGRRSAGMCGIVEKTFEILPKERFPEGQSALNGFLDKLSQEKEVLLKECEQKGRRWHAKKIQLIDTLMAEAGLALATMQS